MELFPASFNEKLCEQLLVSAWCWCWFFGWGIYDLSLLLFLLQAHLKKWMEVIVNNATQAQQTTAKVSQQTDDVSCLLVTVELALSKVQSRVELGSAWKKEASKQTNKQTNKLSCLLVSCGMSNDFPRKRVKLPRHVNWYLNQWFSFQAFRN